MALIPGATPMTYSDDRAMPCPAMAIAIAPASGGRPAATAAGSRMAHTSGTAGVGQKNRDRP
ncbi:Uncharacterised protein [Bordetella pertussis]|nr:Uncharacterised protein [Bordetella pertussis]